MSPLVVASPEPVGPAPAKPGQGVSPPPSQVLVSAEPQPTPTFMMAARLRQEPGYVATITKAAREMSSALLDATQYAVEHKPHRFLPGAQKRRGALSGVVLQELFTVGLAAARKLVALQQDLMLAHPGWDQDLIGGYMMQEWSRCVEDDASIRRSTRAIRAKFRKKKTMFYLNVKYELGAKWTANAGCDLH